LRDIEGSCAGIDYCFRLALAGSNLNVTESHARRRSA
jgi:hypothetical protein